MLKVTFIPAKYKSEGAGGVVKRKVLWGMICGQVCKLHLDFVGDDVFDWRSITRREKGVEAFDADLTAEYTAR